MSTSTRAISERFRDKELIIKRYINSPSLLYFTLLYDVINKKLSYRRETALQGALVLAKSGRMGLEDDILRTL